MGRIAQGCHVSLAEKQGSALSLDAFTSFLSGNTSGRKSPASEQPLTRSSSQKSAQPVRIAPETPFGGVLVAQVRKEGKKIPSVVEMCIGEVEARGLKSVGIYRISGNMATVGRLKSIFNAEFPPRIPREELVDVNTSASLLKLYFRELSDPLFPFSTYPQFMAAARTENYDDRLGMIKDLVQQTLPLEHYTVLEFLVRHLKKVQQESEENKMDASNLAIVFGYVSRSSENFNQT